MIASCSPRDRPGRGPTRSGAARTLTRVLQGTFHYKRADDLRDEDVAFFYAEEANHDAEEAIFQELYGTTTTTIAGA